MSKKYLDKIAKLLRQAESTTNEAEAATFMAAAQRLATATAIDLEVARQHQADKEKRETPIQKQIPMGPRGKQGLKHYVNLFLAIAHQNDVRCNIAHNSTYVIAFGFPSDIRVVEALYASLVFQMVEASDRYLRSGEYRNERVWAEWWIGDVLQPDLKYKPVDGRVARANFQRGFIDSISSRLRAARQEAMAQQEAEQPGVSASETSGALVLANKAVEVRDFYKATSNARGSWGGDNGSTYGSRGATSAGREAGSRARLGGGTAIGGSPRGIAADA